MIFRKIRKSIKYAWSGFRFFIKERNIKIHIGATLFVFVLGLIFSITFLEWVAVTISISLVLSFEIINTVIEELIDLLHPKKDPKVMIVKDLAAAAVFVSAIGSIIIGLLIFLPYILEIF